MIHPLSVLARAFDQTQSNPNYREDFSRDVQHALDKGDHDLAVSTYAAQFSLLTQACQLGSHRVHEEPQTSALFGLLAGAFWHASILTEAHAASQERVELNLKQWVYQDKGEEASHGYDFGIVAVRDDGKRKITLFQAKRPSNHSNSDKIDISHDVKSKKRQELPNSLEKLDSMIALANKKLQYAHLKKTEAEYIRDGILFLEDFQKANTPQNTAMRQRDALTWLIKKIRAGYNRCNIVDLLKETGYEEKKRNLLEKGDNRLFTPSYAYEQVEAFLATALQGWLAPTTQKIDPPNWCHYVQWTNDSKSFPGSIPLDEAIFASTREIYCPFQFSKVLALALSHKDESIGWVVEDREVEDIAIGIRNNHPNIVWAVAADTAEMGCEVLFALGVPEDQIRPALRESSEETRNVTRIVKDGDVNQPKMK